MRRLLPTNDLEPLALARPFALLIGLAVIAGAGIGWGVTGTLAAAVGVVVSVANVWVLERLGARAVRQAAAGEHASAAGVQAGVRLQLALGAKTIILLALVAVLANYGPAARAITPFTLGLLVTVFALVAAGLLARPAPAAELRTEKD